MKRTLFLSFMLTIMLSMYSYSQPPCRPSSKSHYFHLPMVTTYPPVNSGMPLDVLVSYIVADSVCKTMRLYQIKDFLKRQDYTNWSDSLRFFMKYYYRMVDHNPMAAYQYMLQSPDYYPSPNFIVQNFELNMEEKSDSALTYNLLLHSSYILHVVIEDTLLVENTTSGYCPELTVSLANILDTLKGNAIPNIASPGGNSIEKRFEDKSQTSIASSMLFQYCNTWSRAYNYPMTDENDESWIKPGQEYILFLDLRTVCADENWQYTTVLPVVYESSTSAGMYPIVDGNVIDDSNDWGLGKTVPLQSFKDRIQSQIDFIKNYNE